MGSGHAVVVLGVYVRVLTVSNGFLNVNFTSTSMVFSLVEVE